MNAIFGRAGSITSVSVRRLAARTSRLSIIAEVMVRWFTIDPLRGRQDDQYGARSARRPGRASIRRRRGVRSAFRRRAIGSGAIAIVEEIHAARVGWLTRAEIGGHARRARPQDEAGPQRIRACCCFLYNTGARVSEATQLKVRDLQIGRGNGGHDLATLHGKGGRTRQCPLWPKPSEYWQTRSIGRAADDAVFVSRLGTPLHGSASIGLSNVAPPACRN